MTPFDVDYFVQKEHYHDLCREAALDQMLDEAGLEAGAWAGPRKAAHWMGSQLVRLGSRLESL